MLLIARYNQLVDQATKLGLSYRPRTSFASEALGEQYISQIESSIRAAKEAERAFEVQERRAPGNRAAMPTENIMANVKGAAKAPKAPKAPKTVKERVVKEGPTVKSLTDEFNALVPQAVKLGLKAKHHSSLFGSKVAGQAQVDKLKKSIADAGKPDAKAKAA